MCTYWALHNFPNLEIRLDTNILISCSTMVFAWYLLFITATTKTPTSYRYHSIKNTQKKLPCILNLPENKHLKVLLFLYLAQNLAYIMNQIKKKAH